MDAVRPSDKKIRGKVMRDFDSKNSRIIGMQ